jgi:hypothetical protein
MKWETPAFKEINMSAEIGGYQTDFGDGDPVGPAAPRAPLPSRAEADDTTPASRR